MQENYIQGCNTICSNEHHAPPISILRSPAFNEALSSFWNVNGMSGEGKIDAILDELTVLRSGKLYGYDKNGRPSKTPLPIDDASYFDSIVDDTFRKDARRTINRYLERAKGGFRYRLHESMIPMVLLIHLARQINICRNSGEH